MASHEAVTDSSFVVVGAGIAGVSCAEMLAQLAPEEKVLLVSATPMVKSATNVKQMTPNLAEFDVQEVDALNFEKQSGVIVTIDEVITISPVKKTLQTTSGHRIRYSKLCLCHGARPKLIDPSNPHVLGIRDTETVAEFQERLKGARRIMIVGNGGIATEIVHELRDVDIVWVIKDDSISSTFVDPGAAEFFVQAMTESNWTSEEPNITKRHKYTTDDIRKDGSRTVLGGALGPDWHSGFVKSGMSKGKKRIDIQYHCEVSHIYNTEEFFQLKKSETNVFNDKEMSAERWNVYAGLTNGKVIGCDFIVSATGVIPNSDSIALEDGFSFKLGPDNGIEVNENMETSIGDIFASGDVCYANINASQHWFQMRLWTQARLMGLYTAQCMIASFQGETKMLDFSFELFTHVTKFFGFKVVLLGLFNGQGLGSDYEAFLRVTKNKEYVKTVMKDGKMQGALLIGETDLEETFENLILNQMDLSQLGENILDPSVDIEDYFD